MTPRELIRETAGRFREAGIPDPETDSALLLSSLDGRNPLTLRLDDETHLAPGILSAMESLILRRMERCPLQYLLGEAFFCGRRFQVDERALIPRPETELLCEWAVSLLEPFPVPRVLDLCCGSGCVGLTLKAELPGAQVTLSDLSGEALSLAQENARNLSLDVVFCRGDLLAPFAEASFDFIACNPPYIPSADCASLQPEVLREPLMALDGGPDGLDFYRKLIPAAFQVLSPGGMLLMELGVHEANPVRELLLRTGFQSIRTRKDYAQIDRMILGIRE